MTANRLAALPAWLPELPHWAWPAFAGNPFSEGIEAATLSRSPISDIAWSQLQLQQRVGEGASGVIHQASRHTSVQPQPAAVKLFKAR